MPEPCAYCGQEQIGQERNTSKTPQAVQESSGKLCNEVWIKQLCSRWMHRWWTCIPVKPRNSLEGDVSWTSLDKLVETATKLKRGNHQQA